MSEMNSAESFERFREGILKAASRALELGRVTKVNHWNHVAHHLRVVLENGTKMYNQRALSETQVEEVAKRVLESSAVH